MNMTCQNCKKDKDILIRHSKMDFHSYECMVEYEGEDWAEVKNVVAKWN